MEALERTIEDECGILLFFLLSYFQATERFEDLKKEEKGVIV